MGKNNGTKIIVFDGVVLAYQITKRIDIFWLQNMNSKRYILWTNIKPKDQTYHQFGKSHTIHTKLLSSKLHTHN